MPIDSGSIASQVGAAGGLWTHTPVDWRGNEGPTAQPGGWPANAGAAAAVAPNGSTSSAVASTITAVSSTGITATTATINYTVNPAASSFVEYGLTKSYTGVAPVSPNTGAGAKTAALSGLVTATLYHYHVVATSTVGGLTTYSPDGTFTTA